MMRERGKGECENDEFLSAAFQNACNIVSSRG